MGNTSGNNIILQKLAELGKPLHLDLNAHMYYAELSESRINSMKGVKAVKSEW